MCQKPPVLRGKRRYGSTKTTNSFGKYGVTYLPNQRLSGYGRGSDDAQVNADTVTVWSTGAVTLDGGKHGGFYRPRQPLESHLHRLVREHFDQFQAVYDQRYAGKFGFWRPVIATAVNQFLKCGDLREGFARVRCPDCGHELFVAFSCKKRCICPSCHQKRALLLAIHIAEDVAQPVAHRQFVWTIPKRLRIFFRFHRHLLERLPNLAWQTVCEVYRAVLGRTDVVPGAIITIQTFGQLIHFHPHLHGLVTDGAFTAEGQFIRLPPIDDQSLLRLWQGAGVGDLRITLIPQFANSRRSRHE